MNSENNRGLTLHVRRQRTAVRTDVSTGKSKICGGGSIYVYSNGTCVVAPKASASTTGG